MYAFASGKLEAELAGGVGSGGGGGGGGMGVGLGVLGKHITYYSFVNLRAVG